MTAPGTYRWRKATGINREYALFELLKGETPILDVGFTDEGVFEVSFNPGISGRVMEWDHLLRLVEEGKTLAGQDR